MPRTALICLLAAGLFAACSPPEPIRLGFIGGLTGRVADLGEAGRNGFQLAVEQANAAGGVGGRRIEFFIKDDAQDAALAKRATGELVAAKVVAIIGPMTSAMAEPVLAAATAGGIVIVSPTVTTTALTGKDDLFLRVISDTSRYAGLSANYQYSKAGVRKVAITYDTRNRAYTTSWLADFRKTFTGLGGTVSTEIAFESGDAADHAAIVKQLQAGQPDALLFISSAVDTARFAQQAAQLKATQKLISVDWSATERLMELGGKAVDGMHLSQFFDREDKSAAFQAFRQAYEKRFQQLPGFASVAAYDATRVTLEAIGKSKGGESLKQTLLERGPFVGVQQPIRFDRYGDAQREAFVTTIRDGRFVVE